ncbi:hypothetical protein KKH27_07395 [bacterium]|nr:hypothetical protein [bacterium]MBU1983776.1 hypothetical protein [bacterium]
MNAIAQVDTISVSETLDLYQSEIQECREEEQSQYEAIRWYWRTYLYGLGGLVSFIGFATQYASGNIYVNVLGFTYGTLLFFSGWLLLSLLARKLVNINFLHKQAALIRDLRATLVGGRLESNYVLVRSSQYVRMPGHIHRAPYYFFVLNFAILLGSLLVFASGIWGFEDGVYFMLAVGMFLGNIYPIACANFYKQIIGAEYCSTRHDQTEWVRRFEEIRESRIKKKRFLHVFFFCVAVGPFLIFLFRRDVEKQLPFTRRELLLLIIAVSLIFGLVRYLVELREVKRTRQRLQRSIVVSRKN